MLDAIPRTVPTHGDAFAMTFGERTVSKRAHALAGIYDWVKTNTPEYGNYAHRAQDYGTMAVLGGHELVVSNAGNQSRLGSYQDLLIQVKGLPDTAAVFSRQEIMEAGTGIVTRLENRVAGVPDIAEKLQNLIAEKQLTVIETDAQLGKPFKYETQLAQARQHCTDLDQKLKASIEPTPTKNDPGVPTTYGGVAAQDPELAELKRQRTSDFPGPTGVRGPVVPATAARRLGVPKQSDLER